ncbi:sodium:calcium antiporter [Alkaliphilus peptidifermentans]|uniref:Cation:H+ antiporter n=1 Tax=Alkaliphilus peptidifermentans DSM 18978 TaxID=1120976 RepID=A0A1G5AMS1_9FIRM|nr:sodium:calcium antiporter [Alkaliphilus peptidifermentans]SCX79201.1 cation:H+ antiporter [Alkaliphilus peptidifermentans DSM 18978]
MTYTYLLFLFSGILVVFSGVKLSEYGDVIASKTSLGYGFVGGILMAGATSLPEFVTSISSALMDAPDIAIGNAFGSNIFNLMILALVDILHNQGRFLDKVKTNHILAGMFGILMSAIGAMSILASQIGGIDIQLGWISLSSLLIFFIYILGAILILRYESKTKQVQIDDVEEGTEGSGVSLKKAIIGFGFASAIIIWAGINLAYTGDVIAEATGLGRTFVGTLLIAATTSLPELVASISAIKLGAYDMAVGNVLGSNIFNMLMITVTDLVYYKESIFNVISIQHTITAMAGIILSSIAVIGLFYRSKRTFLTIGWDSVFILSSYLLTVYLLYII